MRLTPFGRLAVALILDESGSEILEYALVTAFLSMAVALAFTALTASANTTITNDQAGVSNYGINPPK